MTRIRSEFLLLMCLLTILSIYVQSLELSTEGSTKLGQEKTGQGYNNDNITLWTQTMTTSHSGQKIVISSRICFINPA